MSDLNAAFIKAYAREGEVPQGTPERADQRLDPPVYGPPPPSGPLMAGATSFEPAGHAAPAARSARRATRHDPPATARHVPEPHGDFFGQGIQLSGAENPTADGTPSPAVVQPVVARTGASKTDATIPADAVSIAAGAQGAATSNPGVLRAAYRVDHLTWPPACQRILRAAQGASQRIADHLADEQRVGRKAWLISSVRHAEGRTTIAIALAQLLAGRGFKIALVDADFKNPQLARTLGVSPLVGWERVLSGDLPLDEPLIDSTADRVTLLPLVSAVIDPAVVATSPHWTRSLEQLRGNFDFVLIDSGPLAGGSIASSLAARRTPPTSVDAVLLVRDVRTTHLATVAELGKRFYDAGLRHGGIAENFVPAA